MIGIYKITNPKGRVYIGQAIDTVKRYKQYKIGDFKQQKRLYSSYLKYGWEAHTFEVIEECLIESLNCRERYWQEHFDVLSSKGMNCVLQECEEKRKVYSQEIKDKIGKSNTGKTKGKIPWNKGIKMSPHSAETKTKISLSNTGKIHSEEHREKISKANKGRIHSEETKNKMSNSALGRVVSDETKLKLSKLHKNIPKSENHRKNISIAKKGVPKSKETVEKFKKKVFQFSKEGILIREWGSGKEVEDSLGINKCHISGCCNNKRKTAGGFIWSFKNETT